MATQKKRAQKTSKGIHGGGGKFRGLTEVQKVSMGKGMLVNVVKRWGGGPRPTRKASTPA